MHISELISDLAIMLLTAGVVTVLFKKFNLPLVLGYILAGFLIGPYMPFFFTVADNPSISTWSEIGIIILMFALGLEFNLHKLAEVGLTGFITALTEVGGMLILGYAVGQALGWSAIDSVFLGGMLSMSSTTIIIKAFDELGMQQESFAGIVFGTLIIEDIAGIFMMIILSTISGSESISGGALAAKLLLLVLYLAVWLILGIYLLPTLLNKASTFMNDETLLLMSLGICFGMVLLADALGFSSALGAFLSGSLLAGTVHAERIERLTEPVKMLFGAVFFLSVGMMIEPSMIVAYKWPILIISLVTVFGKLLFSSLGVLFSGNSMKDAVRCGCSLAQIGEFAFIIASLGLSLGAIAEYIYPIIVSVSVLTTLTTPMFIKNSDKIYGITVKLLPEKLLDRLNRSTSDEGNTASESEWQLYLKRYVKNTCVYAIIMIGIVLLGTKLLLPLLIGFGLNRVICDIITLVVIYLVMAVFIRPMLDISNSGFTVLWLKGGNNRLRLVALTGLKLLITVTLIFIPLQSTAGVNGIWLIPVIIAAIIPAYKSGWLASRYLSVEARFLSNFNERLLTKFEDFENTSEWLDEKLHVMSFEYTGATASLKKLEWRQGFGVYVVKLIHGRRHNNLPSAEDRVRTGDTVYVIGEVNSLKDLASALSIVPGEIPTLREFIAGENDAENDIYVYAMPVEKNSELFGRTIKECGIRENYDCMILGLQRSRLPIVGPDVNMQIINGDVIWILGTKSMSSKLLAESRTDF